jgi:hypothetical protein
MTSWVFPELTSVYLRTELGPAELRRIKVTSGLSVHGMPNSGLGILYVFSLLILMTTLHGKYYYAHDLFLLCFALFGHAGD